MPTKRRFIPLGIKIFFITFISIIFILIAYSFISYILIKNVTESQINQTGLLQTSLLAQALTKEIREGRYILYEDPPEEYKGDKDKEKEWKFIRQELRKEWINNIRNMIQTSRESIIVNIVVKDRFLETQPIAYYKPGEFSFHTSSSETKFPQEIVSIDGVLKIGSTVMEAKRFTAPIKIAPSIDRPSGEKFGEVELYLTLKPLHDLRYSLFSKILTIGVGGIIFACLLCLLCGYIITRPVKKLIKDMKIIQEGNLEHKSLISTHDEMELLAEAFNKMVSGLKQATELKQRQTIIEHEFYIASKIQERMMPSVLPQIPGYELSVFYKPAKEVSGDFYDIIQIDDNRFALCIGDVSGKSVPASLIVGMTCGLIRLATSISYSPSQVLIYLNNVLHEKLQKGTFVTLCYMIIDVSLNKILVANAGHPPPLVLKDTQTIHELTAYNGIILGPLEPEKFNRMIQEEHIQLDSIKKLVAYTDGLTEAMNLRMQQFGEKNLRTTIMENSSASSSELIKKIVYKVEEHIGKALQHDDIALIAISKTN